MCARLNAGISHSVRGRYILDAWFTRGRKRGMRHGRWGIYLAASLWPAVVLANPFSSLPLLPSGEATVTGKTVMTLQGGDYTNPLFSPDSHYLAFSREVAQGATELTEIQALDLKTRQVRTLLDAKGSREFAMYRTFVAGFSWKSATTLEASLSDGDVNGANLVYDVPTGKLVQKKPLSLPDDTAHDEALMSAMKAAFPSLSTEVLANALANGYKVGDKAYVVQKNYWKQDNHIWLLDASHQQMLKLIDIPDSWIYSLRGVFAYGNSYIMLVAFDRDAYLVRYSGGRLELLYKFRVKNYQQTALRVANARADRVLFQVVTGPSYEKRENYFFVYDKTGLRKIRDTAAVYDLDVDRAGRLVCFSQWQQNHRQLVIKELKD